MHFWHIDGHVHLGQGASPVVCLFVSQREAQDPVVKRYAKGAGLDFCHPAKFGAACTLYALTWIGNHSDMRGSLIFRASWCRNWNQGTLDARASIIPTVIGIWFNPIEGLSSISPRIYANLILWWRPEFALYANVPGMTGEVQSAITYYIGSIGHIWGWRQTYCEWWLTCSVNNDMDLFSHCGMLSSVAKRTSGSLRGQKHTHALLTRSRMFPAVSDELDRLSNCGLDISVDLPFCNKCFISGHF